MKKANLLDILKLYLWPVLGLLVLGFITNGLNLFLPKIISHGIDSYIQTNSILISIVWQFALAALGTFIFAYLQSIAQTYVSEKVARDMRTDIVQKISRQNYTYIQEVGSEKLLTNLTSDVDHVKDFVGQATVTIISSIFLVIGSGILMVSINWKLGLTVLAIIPLILLTFAFVFSKLKAIFKKSQAVIDWLNKIINESILGSAIVRVLHSKDKENAKFLEANTKALDLGIDTIKYFGVLFPLMNFIGGLATLTILLLGGHYIITDTMSIGDFTAFISYLGIVIFPLIMIGFMSSSISSASASYARVFEILNASDVKDLGNTVHTLKGSIDVKNITLHIGEKNILKNVSFTVPAKTRTAILGPTAAGKTQLMYILMGILQPTSGEVLYDGISIKEHNAESLHAQVALVFQDSVMFNISLKENIAFNTKVTDADFRRALDTAELSDFVETLPKKLDAMVMERGTSLSGGQKQRIMLARALALNPKVLLLDDFTSRVDTATEQKILSNVQKNYPDLTLISVTQKISSIEHFDQIILLMEGEILAKGTHRELMESSTEYVQIADSQKSTHHYEI